MEKVYSGGSIFLAFIIGAITILSIFAVHLIVIPLSYSLFLDLIFLMFYLLILIAVYRTGRVYMKRKKAVSIDNLTSQLNSLNMPKKYVDIKDNLDDNNLISELKNIENDIKLGKAFEHDEEYQYVASTKGNIYHKTQCRLAKAINEKFRAYNNNPEFFEKRKYKPCKLCVK